MAPEIKKVLNEKYGEKKSEGYPYSTSNVISDAKESKYFRSMAPEIKKVLNEKYGKLEKGVEGIDYGYGPAPKNTRYCSYYAAGHDIAKGVFKLIHAAMDDLKHDPEFKAMIKQAVKEAYEEL